MMPRLAPTSAALVLALALSSACARPRTPGPEDLVTGPVRVRVGVVDPAPLDATLHAAPRTVADRTEYLVDLFWQQGCLGEDLEIAKRRSASNPDVLCTLPGRIGQRIVVVAHIEGAARDSGIPEHWSGIALLPSLYRALEAVPREHSFVFAALGGSPRGPDTRAYLERLGNAPGQEVRAIVDLQDVDPATLWFTSADAGLRRDLVSASVAVGRPLDTLRAFKPRELEKHPAPVVSPSRAAIPSITIESDPPPAARHSRPPAVVSAPPETRASATYSETARLLAVFLGYLDETLRLRAEHQEEDAAPAR
jgi:hypothetical protein